DEELRETKRNLWVAHTGFDREVGNDLRGGSEDRGHAGLVEMSPVAKEMCGSLDGKVAAPFQRTNREAPVFVHDPGRKCRSGAVDRGAEVRVEEPQAQLGRLWVAGLDRGQAHVACRDRDRVDRLLAMDRR